MERYLQVIIEFLECVRLAIIENRFITGQLHLTEKNISPYY